MSNENIQPEQLKALFVKETPLIDVRAPVEYVQGCLPGAVNLPILNDEERALIGTTYKQQGKDVAVELGYQIVSGSIKEQRVQLWKDHVSRNPTAVLYCFRGGKRSQITQQWLRDHGVDRPLITGGYKAARHFLMGEIERFSKKQDLLVVSGPTGSGKTQLLHEAQSFYPVVDLEMLARHRGSAFGSLDVAQPTQIDFENNLAVTLLKIEVKHNSKIRPIIEDESRTIGRVYQPDSFFLRLRESQVLWIEEPLAVRVENIFADYILKTALGKMPIHPGDEERLRQEGLHVFAKYRKSISAISKKLGGLRAQEILNDLEKAEQEFLNKHELRFNKVWIEKLLSYYYDPLYLSSLDRRQVRVCFKGSQAEVLEYLKNQKLEQSL